MDGASRVVCPVDLAQGARKSIAQAAVMARLLGTELHLLYVRGGGNESPSDRAGADVDVGLGVGAASALWGPDGADPDVEVPLRLATKDRPAERAIVRYARPGDLIVVHERYGGPRPWRGASPVAKKVVRTAPCPVVIVTASASPPPVHRRGTFTDVVCAVDFSASSMAALRAAVRFVRGRHGRLTVVHVVDDVSDRMIFSGGEAVRVLREHEARLARERRRLLRLEPLRSLDPWQVKVVVASGPPSRVVLAAAADVKADLIAMGTAGLGVLGALLGGSTSRAVLRRAGCPVLLMGKAAVRSEVAGGDEVSLLRRRVA